VVVLTWEFRLDEPGWIFTVVGFAGLAAVAALLVIKVPENRISWLLLTVIYGFGMAIMVTFWEDVYLSGVASDVAATVIVFALVLPGLAIALPLWFPTGRPPTSRWRWVELLAVVSASGITAGTAVVGWVEDGDASSIADCASIGTCAGLFGVVGLIVAMFGAIASLAVRWRRAEGVERAQLRWLVPALAAFGLGVAAEFAGFQGSAFANFMLPAGLVLIVSAITVALLRYRLYEIGKLLRRTASYLVVAAALTAVYAVVALLPALVVGGSDGVPPWLVALATLAALALFDPLRRRVQSVVDRRFDRARHDADRIVEQFADRVQSQTELGSITVDLGDVASEILRPRSIALWTRP
jgi:hypothetical protein